MKTGIVLEGGAVRTIFSTGVCDALLTRDLLPDYVIGVSAGIAYGVSYVSKQSRRNLDIMVNYINDKRYMGFGNLLRRDNRAYFGLDFVFGTIPNELIPFDYDTFAAYPGEVEADYEQGSSASGDEGGETQNSPEGECTGVFSGGAPG